MTFIWQGQKVILKGNDSILVETIRIKQLNGSLNKTRLVPEINLCNLRFIVNEGQEVQLMSTILQPCVNENAAFEALKVGYQEVFEEPWGLLPLRNHDHNISLKEESNLVNLRLYRHSSI